MRKIVAVVVTDAYDDGVPILIGKASVSN